MGRSFPGIPRHSEIAGKVLAAKSFTSTAAAPLPLPRHRRRGRRATTDADAAPPPQRCTTAKATRKSSPELANFNAAAPLRRRAAVNRKLCSTIANYFCSRNTRCSSATTATAPPHAHQPGDESSSMTIPAFCLQINKRCAP